MKITTIGRDSIGGTLGRLWTSAGHEGTILGRDGGDADVVLLAPPGTVAAEALAGASGLRGKVIPDATNRIASQTPPPGYRSVAEYVKAIAGGHVAKVSNLNYGAILDQAAGSARRPNNIWVGARGAVVQLSADIGMEAT